MKLSKVLFKQSTRERVLETYKERSSSRTTKGKLKDSQEKEIFRLALIVEEPIMLRKIVDTKINLFFIVTSAINLATMRSIIRTRKNNFNNRHNNMQM